MISRPDVVIGTASPADSDYPLGGSICRLFNLDTPRHGLRCAEEPSAGSIANVESLSNLESLRRGRIDLGIVRSDVLAAATTDQGAFASRGRADDLRVLFAGHTDMFTLIAHQGSGIRAVADLRGKRIGIGRPGSRQRTSMERVMTAVGLTRNDFADVREFSPAEQNRAFCADELDAIVYSVAHPNGLIAIAIRERSAAGAEGRAIGYELSILRIVSETPRALPRICGSRRRRRTGQRSA